MSRERKRIVVVGGGISGLAAAHRVTELAAEHGHPVEVSLLEAGPRLGGVISSRRVDGYLVEEGPDSILTEKPWAVALARRIGIQDRLVSTLEGYRRSYVARRGRLHATPDGFYLLAPSHLAPLVTTRLFSIPGKLRMGLDLLIPRGAARADESLASFVRRRLGTEALERIAQPMVAGIYGADPEKLSLRATFPRFHEMEREHRSIILALRAGIRRRRRSAGGAASGARYSLFVAFDEGLQVLTDTLAGRLPEGVARTRAPVDAIYPSPEGTWRLRSNGTEETADALVLAVPAHRASELVGTFDAKLGQRLAAIPYGSSATVCLGYPEAAVGHPLDGVGFVVPAVEGQTIIGCTFSHRKYPGRAPAGHALFRAFHATPSLEHTDEELIDITHGELQGYLDLGEPPSMAHVARWPRSMAHFEVGHIDRVDRIWEALRAHPGLRLAGNAYRGIGIPDCIHSGETAAEEEMARLFGAAVTACTA
ncbi:MAG: protoporphyrinogen oxidase [Acidobacteriota bacterium]|jgi:oxygen-dependent protoporphyrinogen oxidase